MATSNDSPYKHFLREWRKHRGYTQEQLAERCGIPKSIISRYESGERRIHIEAQFQLMEALDIRPAQFFSPPDDPSLDALFADQTPETRRAFVRMARSFLGHEDAK
jgi:transcriptional regulator with XRE-family HTH domain